MRILVSCNYFTPFLSYISYVAFEGFEEDRRDVVDTMVIALERWLRDSMEIDGYVKYVMHADPPLPRFYNTEFIIPNTAL